MKQINVPALVAVVYSILLTIAFVFMSRSGIEQFNSLEDNTVRFATSAYYVGCLMARSNTSTVPSEKMIKVCQFKALAYRDQVFWAYPNHKTITPFR